MGITDRSTPGVTTSNRLAGILLLASFVIPLLALIIVLASGAAPALPTSVQDVLEPVAAHVDTYRIANLFYGVGWFVMLLGYGLLSRLLAAAGDEVLALLTFIAMLVAAVFGLLEASFHISVTLWVAEAAAGTGSVPDFYIALRQWADWFQRTNIMLGLLSVAGYGWAILRTRLLSSGVGWAMLAWSGFWLFAPIVRINRFPGIFFIISAVTGTALLLQKHRRPK